MAGNIHAAGFDCGKASTEVEKLICSDDELSKLDDGLNAAYLEALKRTDLKKQKIENQRQWLKNVRNACQNAQCIKTAYEIRLKELRSLLSDRTVPERSASSSRLNEQLLQAAEQGSLNEVKMLLAKGAELNAKDNRGRTALMMAVLRKKPDIVKFLIDRGTDVKAKDKDGQTVLSLALGKNQPEIVQYLKAHGAKLPKVLVCACFGSDDFPEHGVLVYNAEGSHELLVWDRSRKEMCFYITTVSSYGTSCYLCGKAISVGKDEYTYTEDKCRASFTFIRDKVELKMTGSRGDYCVDEDLDGGCGMNAYIGSATYKKTDKVFERGY